MIALWLGTAYAATIAVNEDSVAVLQGSSVLELSLADGHLLHRWPTGGFSLRHVAYSGDRLVAWRPESTLIWDSERLLTVSESGVEGATAPLGDGLMINVETAWISWVDLVEFDRVQVPNTRLRIGAAELERCVPVAGLELVACGGDPGPDCEGTLRTWDGRTSALPLCTVAAADRDGILGKRAEGGWVWLDAEGTPHPLPELPPDAEVAMGPSAWVALLDDAIQVSPRDGSPARTFPLPTVPPPADPGGGLLFGGPLAALRLDAETGWVLAGYPSRVGHYQKSPLYADLSVQRPAPPFKAGDDGRWIGPDGWTVSRETDGVEVRRRGRARASLPGAWEPLDASGDDLILVQRRPRTEVVLLHGRHVRWRRELPVALFDTARLYDGDVIVVLPGAITRLDGETGEVVWAVAPPWKITEILEEGPAPQVQAPAAP